MAPNLDRVSRARFLDYTLADDHLLVTGKLTAAEKSVLVLSELINHICHVVCDLTFDAVRGRNKGHDWIWPQVSRASNQMRHDLHSML